MTAVTAFAICKTALTYINAIAAGNTPDPEDINIAFEVLNDLIDSDSNDPMLVYNEANEVFAFIANKQTYTIGPGGDFDTTRPVNIDRAYWRAEPNEVDNKIDIYDYYQYSQIPAKNIPGSIPLVLWYNSDAPTSTISFWPIPNNSNYKFVLWSQKVVTTFPTLNTTINLPQGYNEYLKTNLAVNLCTVFEREPSDVLVGRAKRSREYLENTNTNIPSIPPKFGGTSGLIYPISPSIYAGN